MQYLNEKTLLKISTRFFHFTQKQILTGFSPLYEAASDIFWARLKQLFTLGYSDF